MHYSKILLLALAGLAAAAPLKGDYGVVAKSDTADYEKAKGGDYKRADTADYKRAKGGDYKRLEAGSVKKSDQVDYKRADVADY